MSICKTCGKEVNGILEYSTHPCNGVTVEYKIPSDNEVREFFMGIGMPNMGFEAFGYAPPTKTERAIFQDNFPHK